MTLLPIVALAFANIFIQSVNCGIVDNLNKNDDKLIMAQTVRIFCDIEIKILFLPRSLFVKK